MDSEDLQKAKEYQKKHQMLTYLDLLLSPLILGGLVVTGLSLQFSNWASDITQQAYLQVVFYFLFFSAFMLLFNFPMAFYSGYILEHRYELSNQSIGKWFLDFLKKTLLSTSLTILLIVALYAFIWNFPDNWWLIGWAGFAGVSYILGKLFPVLIVPIFYKYGKVEDENLKKRIFDLAERYNLPIENVYSLNLSKTTKKPNAAFMGMGKTKRVVLSDTLLDNFTADEIETVVAHELGHYKHKDIWKQLVLGMITSFVAFWLAFRFVEPAAIHFGFDGVKDVASLPLLFLIFFFFYLLLMPIQNGFSRFIERAADRFALVAFPYPDVFISCMDKLGKVNLSDPNPNPVIEWFFYDHPAIGKRIAMAKAWKSQK
jgi:STE24 endopeptidase